MSQERPRITRERHLLAILALVVRSHALARAMRHRRGVRCTRRAGPVRALRLVACLTFIVRDAHCAALRQWRHFRGTRLRKCWMHREGFFQRCARPLVLLLQQRRCCFRICCLRIVEDAAAAAAVHDLVLARSGHGTCTSSAPCGQHLCCARSSACSFEGPLCGCAARRHARAVHSRAWRRRALQLHI